MEHQLELASPQALATVRDVPKARCRATGSSYGDIRRGIAYAAGLECIASVQRSEHHQQMGKS